MAWLCEQHEKSAAGLEEGIVTSNILFSIVVNETSQGCLIKQVVKVKSHTCYLHLLHSDMFLLNMEVPFSYCGYQLLIDES